MNALLKLIAAAGVIATSAAPVFAESHVIDPMAMTCAEYGAMDSEGMMAATHTMDMAMAMTEEEMTAAMAMTDEEKAAMQAEADAAMAAMTEEETAAAMAETETSMAAMVAACATMPDGTVMDAMKSAM
jgi:hypothetical protein